MNLDEFWNRAMTAGVTDPAGRDRWIADMAPTLDRPVDPSTGVDRAKGAGADASTVIAFLRRSGLLTDFQLEAVLADPPRTIGLAGCVLTDSRPQPPAKLMMPARRIADDQSGWLIRLTEIPDPLLPWLGKHFDTLQSFDAIKWGEQVVVFSPLSPGQPFSTKTWLRRFPDTQVRQSASIQVARGLCRASDRLRRGGMRDPLLDVNRIWIHDQVGKSDDHLHTLLWDPGVLMGGSTSDGWLQPRLSSQPPFAPERPGRTTNQTGPDTPESDDVLAIGCWLYEAATGRVAYQNGDQAHRIPDDLTQAVAAGIDADPLLRVLAYAIALGPGCSLCRHHRIGEKRWRLATTRRNHHRSNHKARKTPQRQTRSGMASPLRHKGQRRRNQHRKPSPAMQQSRVAYRNR